MITRGIFKANDIRGIAMGDHREWDAEGAYAIGVALVQTFAPQERAKGIVLGRDIRLTSEELSAAFTNGVLSQGVNVVDIGLASTDELWFASGHLALPGVMFTASHNPGVYNGIKFCLAAAQPIAPQVLASIAEQVLSNVAPAPASRRGELSRTDLLPAYAAHLHSLVSVRGLRRLKVVADAGNGMAGHTLPAVLGPLNLDVVGLFTDPDGTFPNHAPNPLEPENLLDARAAVRQEKADLGLVFDGDADRCFIIDERGEVVTPSAVTAMIASQELQREPGGTIVCNTITSRAVPELVTELGGTIVQTRVGHTFVKAAMAQHRAIFGGEHSAHYYFRDFWGADTGMLAALHVISILGRSGSTLSELVGDFDRYVDSGELNTSVADASAAMALVSAHFEGRGAQDWTDGLTVSGEDWWFNLRASNTEPLLRLNVEAVAESIMEQLRDEVLSLIRAE